MHRSSVKSNPLCQENGIFLIYDPHLWSFQVNVYDLQVHTCASMLQTVGCKTVQKHQWRAEDSLKDLSKGEAGILY